jgi:Zn-dependent M28 family amino/carboxypeptidase
MKKITLLAALIIMLMPSCKNSNDLSRSLASIRNEDLATYVNILAHDSLMGRKPFTEGETRTINYLATELRRLRYEPAFGDSYFQQVPMTETESMTIGNPRLKIGGEEIILNAPDDIAVTSPLDVRQVLIEDSEIVFAGFGIVAPEYGWDDYRNIDVKGKTVLVLINDPGLYTGKTDLFRGREMTYYGRWTYKFEEAARQGAKGVLIIHDTEGAGYEYTIPRKSSISARLQIDAEGSEGNKCSFTGWINSTTAERLFGLLEMNVTTLRSAACNQGYSGFNTGVTIDLTINNSVKRSSSSNVAGILKGRIRPEEVIVYTAHWDHFGIGEAENGDSIYNGAVDNGTSMAWAFEIAEAFSLLDEKPERSIMILFPTAEEQGLIGSAYYVENPVFKADNTVACFNNDLMLPIGRMKDVMITGFGQSELDSIAAIVALKQDRYLMGDPNPHTGMYFRSDHFPFAAKGIPAMFARGNCDSRQNGKEWAAEQEKDYINNRYHRPSDNYDAALWDLSGIREDSELMFEVGYNLANTDWFPTWQRNSEFGMKRDRDKKQK